MKDWHEITIEEIAHELSHGELVERIAECRRLRDIYTSQLSAFVSELEVRNQSKPLL